MAQGLIQVNGFPIGSCHSVFNRKFKRSLKENQSDGQKKSQENLCTNRHPSIFVLKRLFAKQVSGSSTIILLTSPRKEHRRPTWVFRTSFGPYPLRLHERIWVRILALAIYRGATPKASYGTISNKYLQ